jgi:hypothetical protein
MKMEACISMPYYYVLCHVTGSTVGAPVAHAPTAGAIRLRAHIMQSKLEVRKITLSMLDSARDMKLPFVSLGVINVGLRERSRNWIGHWV